MKKTLLMLLFAAYAVCAQFSSKAQTTQVDIIAGSTLCGNVYVVFWAVDPSTCAKTESVPIMINSGSGTVNPNLAAPATWVGGILPPVGFVVEAARIDYGPGCGVGAAPPTSSGCSEYDNLHVNDPLTTCPFSWGPTNCFEDSGFGCATCGSGAVVNGSYIRVGGIVTISAW